MITRWPRIGIEGIEMVRSWANRTNRKSFANFRIARHPPGIGRESSPEPQVPTTGILGSWLDFTCPVEVGLPD
jgi:hypothetical protein